VTPDPYVAPDPYVTPEPVRPAATTKPPDPYLASEPDVPPDPYLAPDPYVSPEPARAAATETKAASPDPYLEPEPPAAAPPAPQIAAAPKPAAIPAGPPAAAPAERIERIERVERVEPPAPLPRLRFDAVIRGDSSKHADGRERRTIAIKKKDAAGFPYREGARVPIDLVVLGVTYGAGVRATASQSVVYIAADLRGPLSENVTLAAVLEGARLQKKQHVTLEVEGTVVRLLPAQPPSTPIAT
jgi:hypothetical protein